MENQHSNYQRLLDAYNDIHHYLCDELREPHNISFSAVLEKFIEQRPKFKQLKQLRVFADLRNIAVHAREFKNPLFDPSDAAVENLEEIRDRLIKSTTAGDRFKKQVLSVAPQDRLTDVLGYVHANNFSQFPVYSSATFSGLLTENGLTRWLAGHVSAKDSLIELGDHCVRDVVELEELTRSAQVIGANTPVDVVEAMFADEPTLEAVIVTHSGSKSEKPIGIATTWDIARE